MSSPDNNNNRYNHNNLWLTIMCTFILLIFFLTVIYNLIRATSHPQPSSSSRPPSNPCSNPSPSSSTTTFQVVSAICLEEYEPGDTLRCMPCAHVFHCACIDRWLVESGLCPVCRRALVLDKDQMVKVDNAERCSHGIILL